nr:MAG TPA: hypothetical protein [Bacteriophage sp.]
MKNINYFKLYLDFLFQLNLYKFLLYNQVELVSFKLSLQDFHLYCQSHLLDLKFVL